MEAVSRIGSILIFSVVAVLLFAFSGCSSVQNVYDTKVKSEFETQPLLQEEVLSESDIVLLPPPVKKYLRYAEMVGKSKPQNVRIEFEAQMWNKPGASPMDASSEQYNFFGHPARIFFMKASKFAVPFRVLHVYANQQATMVVRVASLFNAVDIAGADLSMAETVTVLNDMCVLAPGSLIDKRLSWREIDSLSAQVTFENGPYKVSALLYFNEKAELVNFISDDRSALQDDGTLRRARWSTPLKDYKEFDGKRIASYGEAIWHYPEGEFTYGKFTVKNIKYNLKGCE